MKKIKLLMAAALLFCSAGAWAETDVTSTYITNADFSSTTGWTAYVSGSYRDYGNGVIGTYGVRTNEGQAVSTVDATHLATESCFGFEVRWSGNYAAYQQTTAELPVGHYELSFDVENTNSKTTSASYNNLFYVQVGENKTTDTKSEWMSGKSSWTTHTISFDLTAASTATISLGYGTGSNNIGSTNTPTLHVSHLKLTWEDPLAAAKAALQAEIDKAKLCDAKEGLAAAIATAEGVYASATTTADLESALTDLQAADKDAVLRYENGLADATYAAPVLTDFVVNGTFTDNVNGWTCTGGFQNQNRASNKEGAFTVPFFENWNGSAKVNKMYQTISNIPNGTYRLDIAAFVNALADPNESQYVFANNDKVYLTTVDPTAYEVYTVVTANQIEIGLEQTSAIANWMGIDNVSLRYYGAGDVIDDAKNASHKLAWEEAKAAAEAAVDNSDYANVTGSERTALNTEIAKAEPATATGYDEAAAALTTVTAAFTTAKFYYDAYAEANAIATTFDATAVTAPTTAVEAVTRTQELYVNIDTKVTSTYTFDATDIYSGNFSGSFSSTTTGQHWSGNTSKSYLDNWGSGNISSTQDITLPAGNYVLKIAGRGAADAVTHRLYVSANGTTVNIPNNGDLGKGIDTSGAVNYGEGTYANDNNGRGWEWRFIPVMLTEEKTITVTLTMERSGGSTWGSFCDFTILMSADDLANSDDYAALNAAITAAEAHTLGFEEGQYAPYYNVPALTKLAEAKAIDQNLDNPKTVVTTATTELNVAIWTANTVDMDAIYNGMFETVTAGANYPDGWARTNAWGQMRSEIEGGYATAYYNQPGSLKYGETGIYTMPLAANQVYKLTFAYRSHENNSNGGVTASVLNGSDGLDATVFPSNPSTTDWAVAEKTFVTGAAGNYVLTLANSGNTWMTAVSLVKSAEALVFSEEETYKPVTTNTTVAVNMTRTLKDGYNTIVLPFSLTSAKVEEAFGAGVEIYEFSEDSSDPDDVTINFTLGDGSITANVPVLLKTSLPDKYWIFDDVQLVAPTGEVQVAGTNVAYKGVYAPTTVAAGDYFIGNGALYKSEGATNIKAFRAYIDATTDAPVKMFIDGIATGIEAIDNGQLTMDNEVIYNLAGQRVNKAQKGLFIVNGKKVLIK